MKFHYMMRRAAAVIVAAAMMAGMFGATAGAEDVTMDAEDVTKDAQETGSTDTAGEGSGTESNGVYSLDPDIETEAEQVDPHEPFVAYLSGVDTRDDKLVQSNGDVNVLMVVNPATRNLLLLNTPRDYYLENPAAGNAMDKLTHCAAYGIGNSEKALGQLYGCDVKYYMQVNFVGFEKIIDMLGGITVKSDEAFTLNTSEGQYDVQVGFNDMDGTVALAFARDRYDVAYGDNGRGRDQMRVVEGVMEKLVSDPSVLNEHVDEFLEGLGGTFETDIPVLTVFTILDEEMNPDAQSGSEEDGAGGVADGAVDGSGAEAAGAGDADGSGAEAAGAGDADGAGDVADGAAAGGSEAETDHLDRIAGWNVHEYAVTGHNGVDQTASMSEPTNVMYQDPDLVKHASDLIQMVLNGEELTDEAVGEIVQEW